MVSYAAIVAGKGQKHDPMTKTGSASTTVTPMPLMTARENSVVLKTNAPTSVGAIATALSKQYPEYSSKCMPLVENGHVLLQFSADADATRLLAEGLVLGNSTVQAFKLLNTCTNSSTLHCQVSGFLPDEKGTEALKEALAKYKIVHFVPEYFEGTKIFNGVVNIILDLEEETSVPPAKIQLDRGDWMESIKFRILGKHTYCYFCRSTSHSRLQCTVAPNCRKCNSRKHPTQKCQANPPSSVAAKTSYLPQSAPEKTATVGPTGGKKRGQRGEDETVGSEGSRAANVSENGERVARRKKHKASAISDTSTRASPFSFTLGSHASYGSKGFSGVTGPSPASMASPSSQTLTRQQAQHQEALKAHAAQSPQSSQSGQPSQPTQENGEDASMGSEEDPLSPSQ
jgi:hypothetical protein